MKYIENLAMTGEIGSAAACKQGQNCSKTSPKIKSSEGSGRETDEAEQLDPVLNQSAKVLNKTQEAEETDASMLKIDNRSPPPLKSRDTHTTIIMT